jgi:hypothetical protein
VDFKILPLVFFCNYSEIGKEVRAFFIGALSRYFTFLRGLIGGG